MRLLDSGVLPLNELREAIFGADLSPLTDLWDRMVEPKGR